jgi:amino acid transporter
MMKEKDNFENRRQKQVSRVWSLRGFVMGLLFLAAGVFFFFREKFNIALNERRPPDELDKIFGIICFIYGAWRLYRGYRKIFYR